MKFYKLQKAIDSGLFCRDLTRIVTPPSRAEIDAKAASISTPLHPDHIDLLMEWAGSNLDEIRINSLEYVECDGQYITFANDYVGFIFKYDQDGAVYLEDTDGGEVEQLAGSISEFINDVFLGDQCVSFRGEEWLEELRKHGLV